MIYELEQLGINFRKLQEDIKIKKKKIKKEIVDERVNKPIDAKTVQDYLNLEHEAYKH